MYSCGNSNFAKRRYTKGVYIEKHGHARSKKLKVKDEKYKWRAKAKKQNDFATSQPKEKDIKENEASENQKSNIEESQVLSDQIIENPKTESTELEIENAPPEKQDGEMLTRSKSNNSLAKASIITAYTSLGLILLGFLILIIFAIAIYFSGGVATGFIMQLVSWIIYGIALALAAFALVSGAIVLSKDGDRRGLHGVIVGGIIIGLFLLSLLIALIV